MCCQIKEMIIMGAYAMPGDKPFRTNGKVKRTRSKSRLDRNAAMLRDSKMILDKKNNKIIMVKNDD